MQHFGRRDVGRAAERRDGQAGTGDVHLRARGPPKGRLAGPAEAICPVEVKNCRGVEVAEGPVLSSLIVIAFSVSSSRDRKRDRRHDRDCRRHDREGPVLSRFSFN